MQTRGCFACGIHPLDTRLKIDILIIAPELLAESNPILTDPDTGDRYRLFLPELTENCTFNIEINYELVPALQDATL